MILLYIFLALLALLALCLLVNVHLIFRYGERASVTLRILCFRFDGMKLFSRFTKDREKSPTTKSSPPPREKKPKRSFDPIGFAEFLLRIARVISLAVKEQLSHLKIRLKELHVRIASDDAAKTALLSGSAVQAANYLCALLQRFSDFRCNNENLSIAPDFTSEKSSFSIHLDLSVKPIFLIAVLFRAYYRFFEGKEEDYVRDSVETRH